MLPLQYAPLWLMFATVPTGRDDWSAATIALLLHVGAMVTDQTLPGGVSCQQLTAVQTHMFRLEDDALTLSYKYSRQTSASDEFFWYRQYPGEAPEFLLYISGSNFIRRSEALGSEPKFSSNVSRDRVDLQISSAAVTDSAVYYCAVRPTVTGNPQPVYNNTAPSSWKPSSRYRAT